MFNVHKYDDSDIVVGRLLEGKRAQRNESIWCVSREKASVVPKQQNEESWIIKCTIRTTSVVITLSFSAFAGVARTWISWQLMCAEIRIKRFGFGWSYLEVYLALTAADLWEVCYVGGSEIEWIDTWMTSASKQQYFDSMMSVVLPVVLQEQVKSGCLNCEPYMWFTCLETLTQWFFFCFCFWCTCWGFRLLDLDFFLCLAR